MAANEYYQSFQTPPPYSSSPPGRPSVAPVQSPHNYSPQPSHNSQPQYLKPILKNSNSHQGFPSPQPWDSSYPAPVPYQGSPLARPSNNNLLAPPMSYALAPSRSKSEPPENRRTSLDTSYDRHHHHHRHHSRSRSRSSRSSSRDYRDRSISRSRSRSRSRSHHSHHSHNRKRSHSGRDTFIGAGAGGIIGDAIMPGLGTLWGALAGGMGGHEYSGRKGRSSRSKSDSGYRDGITVHSGWIRR